MWKSVLMLRSITELKSENYNIGEGSGVQSNFFLQKNPEFCNKNPAFLQDLPCFSMLFRAISCTVLTLFEHLLKGCKKATGL